MKENYSFKTRQDFRTWLACNVTILDGIWICFDKGNNSTTLKASEALEEALCFGWIDGQMKSVDANRYLKYFSPRRKNSKWSEKNKALVLKLEEKGLMQDEGRKRIQEAKNNGQWDIDNTVIVGDENMEALCHALIGKEPAYKNFMQMSMSVRKTYVKAYVAPKTKEGQQKRLEWIIDRLHKNLKPM